MPPLHLSTIITRTPSTLHGHIASLSSRYGGQGHTVLFALSSNFGEPNDLQKAVNTLTKFNDKSSSSTTKGRVVGCLADSFTSTSHDGNAFDANSVSCSIGIFDSRSCIPFHSTLQGRQQPQVGRWHSFRNKTEEASSNEPDWQEVENASAIDWENIWKQSKSSVSSSLPHELRSTELSQIRSLLSFSSPHPDKFTHVLAQNFQSSSALTLVASPTHFITGREVTLFMDGQIYGEGAVGLALVEDEKLSCATEFAGVNRLSGPMTITSQEGNMINELNSSNPTRLLIDALGLARISPQDNEQFALGVVDMNGQITRTYRITAGDPSSRGGSISLDAPTAPEVGTIVQFLHFPANSSVEVPGSPTPTVAFLTTPEPCGASTSSTPDLVLENMFTVPSTRGFVLSSKWTDPWTCSLPGGVAKVQWK
ncbi:hypothetical protein CPC08DRAFT_765357 [Agrocybe pediades]|nr:hypothetical protein CPC08DRAFT_765357 [Agrocybe pediades]